jgi:hypothetical protein
MQGTISPLGQVIVIGGRGDQQYPADRLDPMLTTMIIDERHHHFDADFWGKHVRCLAHDAPSYSGVGAFGKPAAVHGIAQSLISSRRERLGHLAMLLGDRSLGRASAVTIRLECNGSPRMVCIR